MNEKCPECGGRIAQNDVRAERYCETCGYVTEFGMTEARPRLSIQKPIMRKDKRNEIKQRTIKQLWQILEKYPTLRDNFKRMIDSGIFEGPLKKHVSIERQIKNLCLPCFEEALLDCPTPEFPSREDWSSILTIIFDEDIIEMGLDIIVSEDRARYDMMAGLYSALKDMYDHNPACREAVFDELQQDTLRHLLSDRRWHLYPSKRSRDKQHARGSKELSEWLNEYIKEGRTDSPFVHFASTMKRSNVKKLLNI